MKTSRDMPFEIAIAVLANLITAAIIFLLVNWPEIVQWLAKLG